MTSEVKMQSTKQIYGLIGMDYAELTLRQRRYATFWTDVGGNVTVGRDSRFERLVRGVEGVSTSREAFAKTCK